MAAHGAGRRGFTLWETVLLAVVVVLFAALGMPLLLTGSESPQTSQARREVQRIARAAARVRVDTGSSSPACYEHLHTLAAPQSAVPQECGIAVACGAADLEPGAACWGGPYLDPVPERDPWGNAYTVRFAPTDGRVLAQSSGPDGRFGTSDDLRAGE